MRLTSITLLCLLFSMTVTTLLGQSSKAEKFLEEGIAFHQLDNTKEALEKYEKAYKLEPENLTVNYYMAFANSDLGNSSEAYKYSKFIIGKGGEYEELAYVFNGAALTELGRYQEAMDIFYEGAGKYLYNNTLHFNLAVAAMEVGQMNVSVESIKNAIKIYPVKGSYHNLFGQLTYNSCKAYSIMGFVYCLMISDEDESSKYIQDLMVDMLEGGTNIETGELDKINAQCTPEELKNEVKAIEKADKKLAEIRATCKSANKKNDFTAFNKNLTGFIKELGVIKKEENLTGFFWVYYVQFFNELIDAGYGEVLSNVVSRASHNADAEAWLKNHMKEFDAMYAWIEAYYKKG